MGENSAIEWTDHTFNPWIGCAKVSTGCKHCYAETMMDRRLGRAKWGDGGTRVRTSPSNWREPLRWNARAIEAGVSSRVFCASLADVFEPGEELDEIRADLFELINQTRALDWLLLTKRPEHAERYRRELAWPHVYLGVSVENQAAAEERVPWLMRLGAPGRRFVSCEPLLGPVDLQLVVPPYEPLWVIAGGESGPGARPMHPDWARGLRNQCGDFQTEEWLFFFKQWGAWVDVGDAHDLTAAGLRLLSSARVVHYALGQGFLGIAPRVMRRVQADAGRVLDGRVHDAAPPRRVF